MALVNAFDGRLAAIGHGVQSTGEFDDVGQACLAVLKLVNRGSVYASGDSHLRSGRGDINHVAGQQRHVFRFIALRQKIIEVELGNDLPIALELNVPHRALGRGPTGGKDGVHQSAQRTDGVRPRTARLAYKENVNRAELPESDGEIEIPENALDLLAKMGVELGDVHSGDGDWADFGNEYLAVSVHGDAQFNVELSP